MPNRKTSTRSFFTYGRSLRRFLLALLGIGLALLLNTAWTSTPQAQTNSPTQTDPIPLSPPFFAPFNQIDFYPIPQNLPEPWFRPVGEWSGRLILPSVDEYQQIQQKTQETDWAWFQVFHAPAAHQSLLGQKIRLAWADTPFTKTYVQDSIANMRFTPDVAPSMARGNIHPFRINGRDNVGPLQSLAGYRPDDDVTVVLKGDVTLEPSTTPATVRIRREPILETGTYYALVKFGEPVSTPAGYEPPSECPTSPCSSEFFQVRHYNPATQAFDGPEAIVRVPQQPAGSNGVFSSTPNDLQNSPEGEAGWYIYGAQDKAGTFTVQALKPRSLLQLKPEELLSGSARSVHYIRTKNWEDTKERKDTAQSIIVSQDPIDTEGAIAKWKENTDPAIFGTRMLVIHLFGARGGEPPFGERGILGTYTGHFAYGLGEVIQDPFTQEPQLDVTYIQIYANNTQGIIAGVHTWQNYMGSMQRGWMSTRPVSDILVKLDALTDDYVFGDQTFSVFNELLKQLSLIAARYRTGDGSGSAFVTAATSCVQDSNQALYTTLRRTRQAAEANPQAIEWIRTHPDDPHVQRFQRLVKLEKELYNLLTPMGIVRWDWNENANIITGAQPQTGFVSLDQLTLRNTLTGLLSWRTATPRQAHDEVAILLLRNQGILWFLRPNQIGGHDPNIYPIPATAPLGAYMIPFTNIPIFNILLTRTFASFYFPSWSGWAIALLGAALFGAIAYGLGKRSGFLQWNPWSAPWYRKLLLALKLLFMPALLEEYIFRVLLLPEPGRTSVSEPIWWICAVLVLGLFVAYHLVNSKYFYTVAKPTFFNPNFLILATLLGLICTIVYRITGSLWTITAIHWIAVCLWLLFWGGMQRLAPNQPKSSPDLTSQPS